MRIGLALIVQYLDFQKNMIYGCHEAIQIYALVEADAERQVDEKTEPKSKDSLETLGLEKAAVVNGVR